METSKDLVVNKGSGVFPRWKIHLLPELGLRLVNAVMPEKAAFFHFFRPFVAISCEIPSRVPVGKDCRLDARVGVG
jgi:hypothetical protein